MRRFNKLSHVIELNVQQDYAHFLMQVPQGFHINIGGNSEKTNSFADI